MPSYMQGIKGALVITWGAPRSGREREALEHLEQFLEHLHGRAGKKEFAAPQFYIATTGNASEDMGMIVLEGDIEALYGLLFDEQFQHRITNLSSVAHNFTTRYYVAGPMAENARKVYAAAVGKLKATG